MKKEEGEATTTTTTTKEETPGATEAAAADSSGPTPAEGEGEKMEEDVKPAASDQGEQGTSSKDEDMDLD